MVTKEDPVWGKASSTPSQERMTALADDCRDVAPLGEASPLQSPGRGLCGAFPTQPLPKVSNWCQEEPSPFGCTGDKHETCSGLAEPPHPGWCPHTLTNSSRRIHTT